MNPFAKRQFALKILAAIVIVWVGLFCFSEAHRLVLKGEDWWAFVQGACGLLDLFLTLCYIDAAQQIVQNSRNNIIVGLTINRSKDGHWFYLCKVTDIELFYKYGASYYGGVLDQSKSYHGINRGLKTWTERIRGWGYNVQIV